MPAHIIIFILAFVGIAVSLYLIRQRKKKRPPVCVIGNECGKVWASPYSRTFGVENEILGVIFYATAALAEGTLFLSGYDPLLVLGEALILAGGAVMSCYFVYIQWHLIRAWCFWCTMSAVIVWAMVLARVLL